MHVDPRLAVGSTNPDTDWTTFVAAAHQRGLKVTTWLTSYVWTGSAMFKAAEAEVRLHGRTRAGRGQPGSLLPVGGDPCGRRAGEQGVRHLRGHALAWSSRGF